MGEPEIDDLVFPTIGGDLPYLLQVVLGILLAMVNRWCIFGKLNFSLVFAHFPNLAILATFILSLCLLLMCSYKVLLDAKVILCGPSDVHGGL